jgi:signal transduction histidine kinase
MMGRQHGKMVTGRGGLGPRPAPQFPEPQGRPHQVEPSNAPDSGAAASPYDELPDGLVVAEAGDRVRVFNRAAERITGLRADHALGRPLDLALPLLDLEGRRWWKCTDPFGGLAIRTGQPETRLLLPDGRDVLVTARYVREHAGPVSRVVVGLRDTSARARVERRHADLIATVAHELRSPLTSVKGFTATLLAKWERFTDDQRRLMLETVDADADRVTRLIAELLDIARIDSGRLQLGCYPFDLLELVGDQIAGMNAAGVDVDRFEVRAAEPYLVWADPDKLRQVVANLLENAVRHGEGRVTITVAEDGRTDRAEPDEPEAAEARKGEGPRMIAMTVDDEGPGIPEAMLSRVFTRFWRGNRRGGTGLGLYIVKGIVEAHGGTITVGRAPGGGARFRFTVPAA